MISMTLLLQIFSLSHTLQSLRNEPRVSTKVEALLRAAHNSQAHHVRGAVLTILERARELQHGLLNVFRNLFCGTSWRYLLHAP